MSDDPRFKGWEVITPRLGLSKTYGKHVLVKEVPGKEPGTTDQFIKFGLPDGVQVVGVTREGKIVAITEFRQELGLKYCHLVGETVKKGESPSDAARRGFEEETGYKVGNLHELSEVFRDSGNIIGNVTFFLATDCVKAGESEPDITVQEMDIDAFETMLYAYLTYPSNKARGGGNSVIALWLYLMRIKNSNL